MFSPFHTPPFCLFYFFLSLSNYLRLKRIHIWCSAALEKCSCFCLTHSSFKQQKASSHASSKVKRPCVISACRCLLLSDMYITWLPWSFSSLKGARWVAILYFVCFFIPIISLVQHPSNFLYPKQGNSNYIF